MSGIRVLETFRPGVSIISALKAVLEAINHALDKTFVSNSGGMSEGVQITWSVVNESILVTSDSDLTTGATLQSTPMSHSANM